MAEIRYNNSFSLAGGFNITNAEPIDSRMYVADIAHIYSDENWTKVKPYPGLIVSDPNGEVRVCVNSDYSLETSWKKIGGNGNVSVATIEEANALAIEENLGQVIYVTGESMAYIVSGEGVLMKLATSTAGDIDSIVAALQADVKGLQDVVGNEEDGLVKDVKDLQDAVDAIEIPVKDVQVDGVSVLGEDGVASIVLPDMPEVPVKDVTVGGVSVLGEDGVAVIPEVDFTDVNNAIDSKVSKEEYNTKVAELESVKHSHENMNVLNGINSSDVENWNKAQSNVIEKIKVNEVELVVADSDKSVNIVVPSAPVQGVADGDKVISLNGDKLSATLSIDYVPANGEEKPKLRLKGINNEVISEFDATAFVKDGMLSGARLEGPKDGNEEGDKYLVLSFNTESGKEDIRMDVTDFLDYYVAGDGLNLEGNSFSVKVDTTSNDYLQVTTAGVSVSQSFIDAIDNKDNAVLDAAESKAAELANAAQDAAEAKAAELANAAQDAAEAKAAELANAAQAAAESKAAELAEAAQAAAESKAAELAEAAQAAAEKYADDNFVKLEGFNEFTEEIEAKFESVEEGAQVNVIESISVNGVDADINEKGASVKVDAKDIELGKAITSDDNEVYGATNKLSDVLQGIQDSISVAVSGSLTGVVAGNGVEVSAVSANKQTVSAKISSDDNNMLKLGTDNGLFVAMYYDGDDAE